MPTNITLPRWTALPQKIPDRIVLNWSGDPATTASVTWRTDASITKAEGQIAEADASPNFITWARGKRRAPKMETLWKRCAFPFGHLHRSQTGHPLCLSCGKRAISGVPGISFAPASANPDDFTFIYLGDSQNNLLALWSRTIRTAVLDAPHADFLLYAGDLVNHANMDSEWQEWFEAGGWIHAKIPSIPSPGNHEYENYPDTNERRLSTLWRPHFTLPENGPEGLTETTYFTDYQGARIISLNSCERHQEQAVWLEKTLQDNPNKWTIVTFHHPVFSASEGRDNVEQRKAWKPLLDEYAVDLVLQGHDHTYARGNNIGSGVSVRDPNAGTVYVVSVSGPKQYKLGKSPLDGPSRGKYPALSGHHGLRGYPCTTAP